ncbi:hypothetical protein [Mesorhizobium sp.]|uniref:hypothetical protein n=1 Tax=Mesorhizobium sp. TaxID=1871066 RepID=UPI0025B9A19A|nr:hypothetical protein [Mesorhizobium sp.]
MPALALFLVQAFATEIETAKGPVTVGKTPQTLAVFDIARVDTLNSLGVKIAGLPDKLYVPELAGLKDGAEIVGTLFEPDLEALSALAPDLTIVGGRSSPQPAATSRIAQSIDMTMDGDDLYAQAKQRLTAYGAHAVKELVALGLLGTAKGSLEKRREDRQLARSCRSR